MSIVLDGTAGVTTPGLSSTSNATVTGTLGVTGLLTGTTAIFNTGATNSILINKSSTDVSFGIVSLNGVATTAGMIGILGGADLNLYINVPTGGSVYQRVNSNIISQASSTGLSVTGTISSTGAISVSGATGAASSSIYNSGNEFVIRAGTANKIRFAKTDNSGDMAEINATGVTIPGTLGLGSAGTAKLNIVGVSATSTEYALYVTNSTPTLMFGVRDDGYMNIGTAATSPYNNTSASSANLFVDSNGSLFRSTSSLKYKENLQDLTLTEAQTITFGRHAFSYSSKTETSDRRYIGYGAEEIAPVDSRFAQLDADGIPDGVAYDRFVIPHGIILSDHESRLAALEQRLAALEAK